MILVIVNGGSDQMVKRDPNLSINPFLAMWSMITQTTERGSVIVSEEAISREEEGCIQLTMLTHLLKRI